MSMKVWTTGDRVLASDINANFAIAAAARYKTLVAGEALTAGNAVCVLPVPSSAVAYDTSVAGNANGSSSTPTTISFTVGSNNNRKLVVITDNDGGAFGNPSVSSVTYNGVSMSSGTWGGPNDGCWGSNTSQQSQYWILDAPATGTHNLVINFNNSTSRNNRYFIYSFYNCASATVLSSNSTTSGSSNTENFRATPVNSSSIIFGFYHNFSFSSWTMSNNVGTQSGCAAAWSTVAPQSEQNILGSTNSGWSSIFIELAPITTGATGQAYKASSLVAGRASTFIGFAQQTVSAAANVDVAIDGLDANQSGLIPGTQYYLNDTPGTIGTSAGTNSKKIGIALSGTEVQMTLII